jgi:hypothetical protein
MHRQSIRTLAARRLAIAALLLLGVAGAGHDADAAAKGAALTIHHRFCPEGYAGSNYFADCHGEAGLVGIPFVVEGPKLEPFLVEPTGAKGDASFTNLPPAEYHVRRAYDRPGLAIPYVFCAPASSPGTELLAATDTREIVLDLAAGDAVICDWYTTPERGWRPDRYSLPVLAVQCERDPGGIGIAMGGLPEGCRGLPGVAVAITLLDGTPVGSCTTGERGGCRIVTPASIVVRAKEDPATLPDGYRPKRNPVDALVATEYAAAIFVNLPAALVASATPSPVGP